MSGEAWLYLLAVLINAVNLFLQVFFTIMYSDLEWFVPIVLSVILSSVDLGDLHLRNFCEVLQITKCNVWQSWQSSAIIIIGRHANLWDRQRLHQPDRSLQSSEHLHYPRSWSSRILDLPFPYQRVLVGTRAQPTAPRIQCQEVRTLSRNKINRGLCVAFYEK